MTTTCQICETLDGEAACPNYHDHRASHIINSNKNSFSALYEVRKWSTPTLTVCG